MFFISAGCSYSQVPNRDITWPVHVQKAFGLETNEVYHSASGGTGNRIISRKVIHAVTQALKTHKPEDLLVGILWSGCDRHSLVIQENEKTYNKCTKIGLPNTYSEFLKDKQRLADKRLSFNNPLYIGHPAEFNHFLRYRRDDPGEFNHYTLNAHWDDELTFIYYNNFVDTLGSLVQTCEDILRTEWFLKKHNIKYFMAEYDFDTFFFAGISDQTASLLGYDKDCPAVYSNHQKYKCDVHHPDVKYLYDMIDKDYWLPIKHLGDWVRNVSKFDYRDPKDPHPSTEQHIDFTKQIILPFLEKKYGITKSKLP